MKVIIAGSRSVRNARAVDAAMRDFVRRGFTVTEVVSGGARGADELGEQWATERGIPYSRFPADWDAHGKAAGPIRNREMAEYAEGLVAIWDGDSRGTYNMIEEARKRGLPVHIHLVY